MTNGENPAMNAVQAIRLQSARYGASLDARGLELRERNHPVLPRSHPHDLGVREAVGEF